MFIRVIWLPCNYGLVQKGESDTARQFSSGVHAQFGYVLETSHSVSQQGECFCSKLGLEGDDAKLNRKTAITQIQVICHLLPFVK